MMTIFINVILVLFSGLVNAQNPVSWTYYAKKVADKTYEIKLTATVKKPWHIYSQTTPEGGPLPTKIKFNKNPLITLVGKAKETGKLVKKYEEVFDVDVKYFYGNVTFIQTVKLKANAKTTIGGVIEFMACNDEQCMPPAEVKFSILLQ